MYVVLNRFGRICRNALVKYMNLEFFYLHKEIATLSQGTMSVVVYFSYLKEMWEEFDSLMPYPGCDCAESKIYATYFEY